LKKQLKQKMSMISTEDLFKGWASNIFDTMNKQDDVTILVKVKTEQEQLMLMDLVHDKLLKYGVGQCIKEKDRDCIVMDSPFGTLYVTFDASRDDAFANAKNQTVKIYL